MSSTNESERDGALLDGEQAAGAVVAVVAGLANPVLGMLFAGGVAVSNNRRWRLWAETIDKAILNTERMLDPNDEQTVSIFNQLSIGALQTSRTNKRELMADALLNSGSKKATPDFLQDRFAQRVVDYSVEHVTVLEIIHNPTRFLESVYVNLHGVDIEDTSFRKMMPMTVLKEMEEPMLVLGSIFSDLERDRMISSVPGEAGLIASIDPNDVTAEGHRFLQYVRGDGDRTVSPKTGSN